MRRGLTLAELLVVACIVGVLAAILTPVVVAALRAARRTACCNNLRQIGICALAFSGDNGGRLPAEGNKGEDDPADSPAWFYRLPPYVDQETVKEPLTIFQCPLFVWSGPRVFDHATPKSYKMNAYLDSGKRPIQYVIGSYPDEKRTVLFIDAVAGETGMGQWGHCFHSAVDETRHHEHACVLFLDFHVESIERHTGEQWRSLVQWKPWERPRGRLW